MGQLFFRKVFQDAIRTGTKTTTIRRWKVGRPRFMAGRRVFSPGLGWLMIDAVDGPLDLDVLADADAQADGFANVGALRDALAALYPDAATDEKAWHRIRFTLVEPMVRKGKKATAGQGSLWGEETRNVER